jgi:hypothetical protein
MKLVGFKNLCTPAYVYLVISMLAIAVIGLQNYNNIDVYCIGDYSCKTSTALMFVIKIIYVLFWTWILNIICNAGAEYVAWFLVLFPYILLFILISMMMIA